MRRARPRDRGSRLPIAAIALAAAAVACGDEAPPAPTVRAQAAERFPSLNALHAGVIARSCSPSRGVCHNSSNYPDLSTPGNLLHLLGAPCNLELPDPKQGWDGCERPADRAVTADFASELAWGERIERGVWRLGLRDAATVTATRAVRFERATGEVALDLALGVDRESARLVLQLQAGAHTATVSVEAVALVGAYRATYDPHLAHLIFGDPNGDGVYGAESSDPRAAIIAPGSTEASYLWRRITGTVPGSRMPLANAPLTPEEYLALACWIEGLGRAPTEEASRTIDYAGCAAAERPFDALVAGG